MTIKKTVLALACVAAFTVPNLTSAQTLLDTGDPNGGTGTFIIGPGDSLAAEFKATAGQTVTSLAAYLTQDTGGQGKFFTFDIYTSLPSNSNRNATPVFATTATFTADGWNSAAVNWTPTTTGDYWIAIGSSSSSSFDAPGEASAMTGSAPALGFAFTSGNSSFTVSNSAPIGVEVIAAAPEPSTWALMLGSVGLLAFWRTRKVGA